MLDRQNVQVVLSRGVDTKTDPKQEVPGSLSIAENVVYTTPGEVSKRNGYSKLSQSIEGGTSITASIGGAIYKKELLNFDGSEMYSYSPSLGENVDVGDITQINSTEIPVFSSPFRSINQVSSYHSSGMAITVWEEINISGTNIGLYYSVIDTSTNTVVVSNSLISATGINARVYPVGNFFIVLYALSGGVNLYAFSVPVYDPTNPSSVTTGDIELDDTYPFFDGVAIGSTVYIVFNSFDSFVRNIYYLSLSLDQAGIITFSTTTMVINDSGIYSLCAFTNTAQDTIWIGFATTNVVKGAFFDPVTFVAPTAYTLDTSDKVRNITGFVDTTTATYIYEVYDPTPTEATYWGLFCKLRKNTLTTGGTAGSAAVFLQHMGIASKFFKHDSSYYFMATYSSYGTSNLNYAGPQNTYFIVDSTGVVRGKSLSLRGGGFTNLTTVISGITSNLVDVSSIDSDTYICALLVQPTQILGFGTSTIFNTGVSLVKLDFDSTDNYQFQEGGNNCLLSGSVVQMYDGVNIVEHGFHLFPPTIVATYSGTGGSISTGSYIWIAVYEWTDAQGQVHRSAPSVTTSATGTVGGGVTTASFALSICYLPITQKSNVAISIYRSDDGGPFLLLKRSGNLVASAGLSYTDTTASLTGNTQLYTTGNVVANDPLPPTKSIFQFKSRLIGIPSEQPDRFWYSKSIIPGYPVEFSQSFVQNVTIKNGTLVGGIQMDDKLILFTDDHIFFVVGEGPSDNGSQNDYSDAQVVSSDVGCVEQKSIVLTPSGVIFKSVKGWYLLDRGLSTYYIGYEVEAYNGETVIASTLVKNQTQVRIVLGSGICLAYDYLTKPPEKIPQWGVFKNHSAVDALNFQNLYCLIKSDGSVWQESVGSYLDNGSFIGKKIQTSWLSLAGVQGFQRVRRLLILGTYYTQHKLQVDIAYDFNEAPSQTVVIDSSDLYVDSDYGDGATYGADVIYGGATDYYQYRIPLNRQKCDSIQITLTEIDSGVAGAGFSLSNLAFEVGVKRGLNKLPATRSVGS